jgi:hypothetical protein
MLTQEIVERALGEPAQSDAEPPSARQILENAGRVRPIGAALRSRIIPGVTHEEVRAALGRASGPALSEILLAQRGCRS